MVEGEQIGSHPILLGLSEGLRRLLPLLALPARVHGVPRAEHVRGEPVSRHLPQHTHGRFPLA